MPSLSSEFLDGEEIMTKHSDSDANDYSRKGGGHRDETDTSHLDSLSTSDGYIHLGFFNTESNLIDIPSRRWWHSIWPERVEIIHVDCPKTRWSTQGQQNNFDGILSWVADRPASNSQPWLLRIST